MSEKEFLPFPDSDIFFESEDDAFFLFYIEELEERIDKLQRICEREWTFYNRYVAIAWEGVP